MYPASGDYCGYFCSLFDFSFRRFVTPKVIRILFGLAVLLILVFTVLMIINNFRDSVALGIITLIIIGPLYFIVTVTITRIVLEIVMVLFRIGEHVAKLAGESALQPLVEPAPATGPTPPPGTSGPGTEPPAAPATPPAPPSPPPAT